MNKKLRVQRFCGAIVLIASVQLANMVQTWAAERPLGVLFAVGDIARCGTAERHRPQDIVAKQLAAQIADVEKEGLAYKVVLLGDLAYPNGTSAEYADCFAPSWRQFRKASLPTPGNHDYNKKLHKDFPDRRKHARPFFDFFAEYPQDGGRPLITQNGPGTGYYKIQFPDPNTGPWLLISINPYSLTADRDQQMRWLSKLLASNPSPCVLIFTHPFRFSSGYHGHDGNRKRWNWRRSDPLVRGDATLHRTAQKFGASVILGGHDHHYEQFARQDADGNRTDRGIRSFIVGTGGARLYDGLQSRKYIHKEPNSEASIEKRHGFLRMEVYADRYSWRFIQSKGEPIELSPQQDDCTPRQSSK